MGEWEEFTRIGKDFGGLERIGKGREGLERTEGDLVGFGGIGGEDLGLVSLRGLKRFWYDRLRRIGRDKYR